MVIALWLACSPEPGERPEQPEEIPAPEAVLGVEGVVRVGDPVPLDATGSVGAAFAWDFGDGSTGEGSAVEHVYSDAGRVTVRLVVTSADGRSDTASAPVVVVWPPLSPAPTSSGRLALADGVLMAALPDTDEIAFVEGSSIDRRAVCGHPLAVSAAGGVLAVACRDDAVQLWNLADRTLLAESGFRWGARPVAVAVDPAGGAWVGLAGTGEVAHVALDGSVVTTGAIPDPRGLAAAGGVVYASRFRSPEEFGVAARFGAEFTEIALTPDPGPDSDTDARGLPTLLGSVAVSPDGRTVVIGGSKANIERGLLRDGLPLTHETASRSALRQVDSETGIQSARALFDNRDRVGALAFTPLGDRLLVAHYGAGVVDFLDPVTLARIGGLQNVGVGLDGLATDGHTVWVLASVDGELIAYSLDDENQQVERSRLALADPDPGERVFAFAGDPRMSRDAYLSCAVCHPDGEGDGRTWDFTDRGEGFRDTPALFAMPSSGPFHWTANFDELQDFENAIRIHQAGLGFLSDADFAASEDPLGSPKLGLSPELDAMAERILRRVDDVPRSPWREADGRATAAGIRGRGAFLAAGCDSCHAGPEGTDALLHDLGTLLPTSGYRIGEPLTGIRTPSLRGAFATAPYLHDGRAATLDEAVAAHPTAPVDRVDLVAYLLEIEGAP